MNAEITAPPVVRQEVIMTTRRAKRLPAHSWVYVPASTSPIGGGLVKLGKGSTWAAVAVGTAPYAICGMLVIVFVIGYIAALIRYLCTKPEEREAMERLITVSANAIVSILTLTVAAVPVQLSPPKPPAGEVRADDGEAAPGKPATDVLQV